VGPPRRIVYGKLYHRRSSRFQKRQRTTLRSAWTRGVIIWLVNFYRARTEHLFLLYEGHYTVDVPAHFSRERPLFLLSTFPRSLSRLLSTASSLSLSVAQIYVQRQGSPPSVLVRDAELEFLVPFPCCLCSKVRSFLFARFSMENRIKRYSQSDVYPDIISSQDRDTFA